MRLPQVPPACKASILPLLISLLLAPPALAQDTPDRQPLFGCSTDPQDDKGYLWLSGIEQDDGTFADLTFERSADHDGHLLMHFPPSGTDAKTAFLFSHSEGPEGYLVSVRFAAAGTDYVYYSLYVPPDPNDPYDAGGGQAGLVSSKDGRPVEAVACAEAPTIYIEYMRRSMSCDSENPYGPAACEDPAPTRQTPLDVNTIGIVR